MRKLGRILLLALILVMCMTVCAYADAEASGEPSAEPASASGEMSSSASGEPSEEIADVPDGIDVTVMVNGAEFTTVEVGVSREGNVYSFEIAGLLDALGLELTYDEESDVATLSAVSDDLYTALTDDTAVSSTDTASGEPSSEPAASAEPGASSEPTASAEPAPADAEEEKAAVASGEMHTEPGAAAALQPSTEDEYDAYEAYLRDYMNTYDGIGDGTFDDGARDMALGELDGVGFGADVYAFPFEMYVTQFGAKDYAAFAATLDGEKA